MNIILVILMDNPAYWVCIMFLEYNRVLGICVYCSKHVVQMALFLFFLLSSVNGFLWNIFNCWFMTSVLALLIFSMSGVDSIQENIEVPSKGTVHVKGGQSKKTSKKGHGYVYSHVVC